MGFLLVCGGEGIVVGFDLGLVWFAVFLILSLCILLFYGPGAWSVMSHNSQANLLIS